MIIRDLKSCIQSSSYTMEGVFVDETVSRDPSGQILREWAESAGSVKSMRVEPILGGGIRVVGSTRSFGADFEEVEWAKAYVPDLSLGDGSGITKSHRVYTISSPSGELIFSDGEGDSVVFGIMGITPVLGPFGEIEEFELLLKGVTGD